MHFLHHWVTILVPHNYYYMINATQYNDDYYLHHNYHIYNHHNPYHHHHNDHIHNRHRHNNDDHGWAWKDKQGSRLGNQGRA